MSLETGSEVGSESGAGSPGAVESAPAVSDGGAAPAPASGGEGGSGSGTSPGEGGAPSGGEGSPAGNTPPPAAAYTPNFKFKVMDKEHEVDEFLRSAIKDQKHEKRVHELYQKALGLDHVKPKYEQASQQLQMTRQGFAALQKAATEGNLDELLGFFKVPEEKLFQHVTKRLQYLEMPPEQRAELDRQRQQETRATQAELQLQQYQESFQQQVGQMRLSQLDTEISRPDIAEAAQEFDSRVGRPGAFRDEVIRRGKIAWDETRKDLPVSHAVKEVMQFLGYEESDSHPQGEPAAKIVNRALQKKLPTIPNLGTGGSSPVKKVMTSLADLRERAKQAANE